jgi:phage host-nuclease inhibitor protein Gam
MGKRIKATRRYKIETRQQAEATLGMLCESEIERNRITLEMDASLTEIRQEFEGRIDPHQRRVEDLTLALEDWATANPQEFPSGRKSIDFVHGEIGFRTGMPKFKKLRRFKTLQLMAEAMRKLAWARKYVKQSPPTVNKELVIANRDKLTAEQLNTLGIQIVQDESFYVDPKTEVLQRGATVAE